MSPLIWTEALVSACMCATLALSLLADSAAAAEKQNVLVLGGRDSQQPAHEQFLGGFRAGLSARGGEERLQLYTEFFDFVRFPQAEHKILMRQYLQEKYAATRIDVLVSTSRDALDFVLQHRNVLFPNVPTFLRSSHRTNCLTCICRRTWLAFWNDTILRKLSRWHGVCNRRHGVS